jgi:hypothetical protein
MRGEVKMHNQEIKYSHEEVTFKFYPSSERTDEEFGYEVQNP